MIFEYSKYNDSFPNIELSKNFLPDWYTSIKNNDNKTSVKKCMPFLDSLLSGYMVKSAYDIVVENGNIISNNINYRKINSIPIPEGYFNKEYMWSFLYNIQIEKGFSLLITHPLNRHDLPFITLSGIVDADNFMVHGSLTFFIKNSFSGIIYAGTPIAQLIPIKRENWELIENKNLKQKGDSMYIDSSLTKNFYKTNLWNRKEYK